MFDKHVEDQIIHWKSFRRQLGTAEDPLSEVAQFWAKAPMVGKNIDIYKPQNWPDPWQIIASQKYCDVTIALMMGHTIDLSGLFDDPVMIKVIIDSDKKAMYNVCVVQDKILNYHHREVVLSKDLPSSVFEQYSVPLFSYK